MACATDADCAALAAGNWCVASATCDPTLAACVTWPRCRVAPWIGCSNSLEQCVMAQGPDGAPLGGADWVLTPGTATGMALGILCAIAAFTVAIVAVWRRGK
jgi:hypothetical protein